MILSVSRRTDIPAFYSDWFMNRIEEGYVYVRNSFNANQISRIPLSPEVVDCIVFWTKNPKPMMKYLPQINEKYDGGFYFQYTINNYGKEIEPAVPDFEKRLGYLKEISEKYGSKRMVVRYDPIFYSDQYDLEFHKESFRKIIQAAKGHTDTCVISFLDMYDKIRKNVIEGGIRLLTFQEMNEIAAAFSEIVKGTGITIKTCAEAIDFDKYNIGHNSCIDQERIERVIGCSLKVKADKQRDYCQCVECADIGQYNTCKHGCKYCYANYSMKAVENAVMQHSDDSPLLTGRVEEGNAITEYGKAKSLKRVDGNIKGQMSLFDNVDE